MHPAGQSAFFQLYVSSDRERTAAIVREAERLGFQGLFVTVDVAWPGRREGDMRNKFTSEVPHSMQSDKDAVNKSAGVMGALKTFFDPNLAWEDLEWLASLTSMPLVLKGVQTGEDAVLAARHPLVAGIVVSNHGELARYCTLTHKAELDSIKAPPHSESAGCSQPS